MQKIRMSIGARNYYTFSQDIPVNIPNQIFLFDHHINTGKIPAMSHNHVQHILPQARAAITKLQADSHNSAIMWSKTVIIFKRTFTHMGQYLQP